MSKKSTPASYLALAHALLTFPPDLLDREEFSTSLKALSNWGVFPKGPLEELITVLAHSPENRGVLKNILRGSRAEELADFLFSVTYREKSFLP